MKHGIRIALASAIFAMLATGCVADGQETVSDSDLASTYNGLTAVSEHGRYIVKFKDDNGRAALHRSGGQEIAELRSINAVAAHIPEAALNGLRQNPNIEYVEVDPIRTLQATDPYGLGLVQADVIRNTASNPAPGEVKVCIIDSGIRIGHPEFAGLSITGTDDSNTGPFSTDQCGHGTHVAGTVAGASVGVAPDAVSLHISKVFSGTDCSFTFASGLIGALDACEAAGANVVSMSLGGSFSSRSEENAFQAAFDAGLLSIAAAGNDGNTRKSYPASYDSVVSVAAIDESKALASFSQRNSQVELAAPGVAVRSSYVEENSLTVSGSTFQGNHIDLAPLANASGALSDGGLCDGPLSGVAGTVVMCERGAVSFFDKVANVEAAGGTAAVIYNNAPGNFSGTLGDGNSASIPAISLSQEDGQLIVAGLLGNNGDVVSGPGDGYAFLDGTSMATPHVSGVAAAVWARAPAGTTNQDIRTALAATAEDLGDVGRDDSFGFGLVQAQAALDFLLNPPSCDLGQPGDSCGSGSDCCSGVCSGRGKNKTCQ